MEMTPEAQRYEDDKARRNLAEAARLRNLKSWGAPTNETEPEYAARIARRDIPNDDSPDFRGFE